MIYDSILDTIGNTPIVKLHRLAPKHVDLYVKVEAFNPGGSVKDRLAIAIILDAEQKGVLKPGDTVVEATSGNTGVALAMVCAARGYRFVALMADSFSIERRKLMRAYGAKVILTPAAERGSGMVRRAEELAKKHGWFLARQFQNPANPAYHRNTTAAEILRDFAGKRLDYFVTGWGTGGTLTGVADVLRVARPEVKVIATEPAEASLLTGAEWKPHKIQGWTPDFVPDVLDRKAPRRGRCGRRSARARYRAASRDRGRHFRRHLGRRHGRRGAARRGEGAERHGAPRDAAGYRRALSFDVPVRRRQRDVGRRVACNAKLGALPPNTCRPCRSGFSRDLSRGAKIAAEAAPTTTSASAILVFASPSAFSAASSRGPETRAPRDGVARRPRRPAVRSAVRVVSAARS